MHMHEAETELLRRSEMICFIFMNRPSSLLQGYARFYFNI